MYPISPDAARRAHEALTGDLAVIRRYSKPKKTGLPPTETEIHINPVSVGAGLLTLGGALILGAGALWWMQKKPIVGSYSSEDPDIMYRKVHSVFAEWRWHPTRHRETVIDPDTPTRTVTAYRDTWGPNSAYSGPVDDRGRPLLEVDEFGNPAWLFTRTAYDKEVPNYKDIEVEDPGFVRVKKPRATVFTARGIPIKQLSWVPITNPSILDPVPEYIIYGSDYTAESCLTDRERGVLGWHNMFNEGYPKCTNIPRGEVYSPDGRYSHESGGEETYWFLFHRDKGLKLGLENRTGFLEDFQINLGGII